MTIFHPGPPLVRGSGGGVTPTGHSDGVAPDFEDFETPDGNRPVDHLPPVVAPMEVVQDTGAQVLHTEVLPTQAPSAEGVRSLSPSSASTYRSCARRWKFRYVDKLPDPPGEAAVAGTFAHRVLEELMAQPALARTRDRAKELARELWPEAENDPDFEALQLDEAASRQFRWRAWRAIEGLWHLEDPAEVSVDATEAKVKVDLDGVPFRGIIDRVDLVGDDLVVVDYKSGRAPSARFAQSRLEQVLLYAAALRAERGVLPASAKLLYLGQTTIDVDVTEENLDEVVGALGETHRSLNADLEADAFAPTTGPLCGWCPYAKECPEGLREVSSRYDNGRIRNDAPALVHLLAPA